MGAGLLERSSELEALAAATAAAGSGRGSVVLVAGEAGIGKTSLLRAFTARLDDDVRLLSTACDDLLAPRVLGPLRDLAAASRGPLAEALAPGRPVEDAFGALLEELTADRPSVLVVEDVHWADDTTLDVLGHAVRRVEGLPALIVLSFRDDELDARHPVRRLLGAAVGAPSLRLTLRPLSPEAVARIADGSGRDPAEVHAVTAGNPFFVGALLAAPAGEVPGTVVEAVLARVGRLDGATRTALEQLSVVPSHAELGLATALLGDGVERLAAAEATGVVSVGPRGIGFRHELARRAIEISLPSLRRRALNAAVVGALRAGGAPDPSRLVHHAVEAGDAVTVLAVAPGAAAEATAAGSHRQALAHLERCARTSTRSASATAQPSSTGSAGSATTPTGSPTRSRRARRPPRCSRGSATAVPSACASCGSRAIASWPATRRRRNAPRARRSTCSTRWAMRPRWPRRRSPWAPSSP